MLVYPPRPSKNVTPLSKSFIIALDNSPNLSVTIMKDFEKSNPSTIVSDIFIVI